MPFPGKVNVYDDRFEFIPSLYVKLPIYHDIHSVVIPYSDLVEAVLEKRTLVRVSCVRLKVANGELLIIAPFDAGRMLDSMQQSGVSVRRA
jgi:hypothetical protein